MTLLQCFAPLKLFYFWNQLSIRIYRFKGDRAQKELNDEGSIILKKFLILMHVFPLLLSIRMACRLSLSQLGCQHIPAGIDPSARRKFPLWMRTFVGRNVCTITPSQHWSVHIEGRWASGIPSGRYVFPDHLSRQPCFAATVPQAG